MRFTFNNTVLGAECGFRRRSKNLSYCTRPHAKASDISEPYDYVTENLFTLAKRKNSMPQSCWQFLKQLHHKSLRSAKRVVVILDNAKYHHALLHKAWREEVKPRFTLNFLPPYSPELNPIERVWKLTRRLCLHNVYFSKLDQVCISAERQFDQWSAGSNALKKLCAIT
jgi:transposase